MHESVVNNFIHHKSGSNEYKDKQTNVTKLTLLYFVVRVRCRRKKFTFTISSPDEFLVLQIHATFTRD